MISKASKLIRSKLRALIEWAMNKEVWLEYDLFTEKYKKVEDKNGKKEITKK